MPIDQPDSGGTSPVKPALQISQAAVDSVNARGRQLAGFTEKLSKPLSLHMPPTPDGFDFKAMLAAVMPSAVVTRWEPHCRPIQRLLSYIDVTYGSWNRYRQLDLQLTDFSKEETHATRNSLIEDFFCVARAICPPPYLSAEQCAQEWFDEALAEARRLNWKSGHESVFQRVAQELAYCHSAGAPARLHTSPMFTAESTENRWQPQGEGLFQLGRLRAELINIMAQNGEILPTQIRNGRMRTISLNLSDDAQKAELTHELLLSWIREAREPDFGKGTIADMEAEFVNGKPPTGSGGRKKLGKSQNPQIQAKLNVYELIRTVKLKNLGWGKQALLGHFRHNSDFKSRVKTAGLTCDLGMFRSALVWITRNPVPVT